MKKQELANLVHEYGDAIITYRSEQSRKLKYNVCTLDFSTPYIQTKKNRAKETNETLLFFCWDTYSYRLCFCVHKEKMKYPALQDVVSNIQR